MSGIKGIIQTHRARLEASGLLRKAGPSVLSPRVDAMRPSLAKVQAALSERPERFAVVDRSPMSILFDHTLPTLELLLVELGEARAERIVARLCEHGKVMIEEHGIEGAREHLGELFKDLPDYTEKIKEKEEGIAEIIEAYRRMKYEGGELGYFRLKLSDKIGDMSVDELGINRLTMQSNTDDVDLKVILKSKRIKYLILRGTNITDKGFLSLAGIGEISFINVMDTKVTRSAVDEFKSKRPNVQVSIEVFK